MTLALPYGTNSRHGTGSVVEEASGKPSRKRFHHGNELKRTFPQLNGVGGQNISPLAVEVLLAVAVRGG